MRGMSVRLPSCSCTFFTVGREGDLGETMRHDVLLRARSPRSKPEVERPG